MTVLTSPTICASHKFTFPSPSGSNGGTTTSSPSHSSTSSTNIDYFSKVITPTTGTFSSSSPARGTTSSKQSQPYQLEQPPQRSHKSVNDSISSINSNTSDLTIYDSASINGMSTETLVDEKTHNKQRINKSFDFSNNNSGKLLSFDEQDEDDEKKIIKPSPPVNIQLPHLKKQMTLPSITCSFDSINSIKTEQSKRLNFIPCQNFKPQIEKLSSRIKYISPLDIKEILTNNKNNLVLDIRPYADYIKSHVSRALNICLPSTLLKRVNFSLLRSIESLPNFEKFQFSNFLQDPKGGNLIVYDFHQNSSNLYHICLKIINSNLFQQLDCFIYLIDTNFTQFNKLYPNLFESGHSPEQLDEKTATTATATNLNNFLPPIIVPPTLKSRSQSLTDISPCYKSTPISSTSSFSIEKTTTPVLQNFTLSTRNNNKAIFKLRHNEELLTPGNGGPITIPSNSTLNPFEENSANLFKLHNIPTNTKDLPHWIKSTILINNQPSTNIINDQFYKLEKLEQKRLVSALSLSPTNILSSPLGEIAPKVSCGIEFGTKNRYKDIFLYDHSRVKLNEDDDNIENYINASYIRPNSSLLESLQVNPSGCNYVATQGPLDGTMGDFWKCVYNLQTRCIISLTDEIENGIVKCSAFWKSGIYKSCQDSISVNLIEEEIINDNIIIRSFSVWKSKQEQDHKVIQIQLINWPDMGTILDPQDILQVVELKSDLLKKIPTKSEFPTLVHCSAGCGRTGTFCAIDLMMNILNQTCDLIYDPIFEIVNDFRKQRISMVQTLRQYYLIYEVLLIWLSEGKTQSQGLIERDIVKKFINLVSR
ncbi:Tyrosine-protein phosphatase non-receptor type 20 [Spathaspora sp. JA1]|nr:Tyrosine-protein phosphatase non-receptor type 20 [Spathaspora sp. JA1]